MTSFKVMFSLSQIRIIPMLVTIDFKACLFKGCNQSRNPEKKSNCVFQSLLLKYNLERKNEDCRELSISFKSN